jgi:hypothetical protein
MNYVVPTFMRCGSTLVTRGICGLLNVKYETFKSKLRWRLSEKESESFVEGNNRVIKTHELVPRDLLDLAMADKVGIISVRRRFLDVLVSYILYSGKKRPASKESIHSTFEEFNKLYKDLPDEVYVNCFIDTRLEFVRKQAKMWLKYDRSFCCKNHVAFDYDTIWTAGHEYMLEKLINTFNLDVDQEDFDRALECCVFEPKGSDSHQRQGIPKDGLRLIDKSLRDQINTIVQQERSKLRNL